VVVLAVDVSRDRPADGDELRAGGGGEEPAAGEEVLDDFGERHAGFALENSGRFVKGEGSDSGGCRSITRGCC